jgi:hypothetical protein
MSSKKDQGISNVISRKPIPIPNPSTAAQISLAQVAFLTGDALFRSLPHLKSFLEIKILLRLYYA